MDKILVIDDSPVQTGFLCSILQDDYEITACHTAEEGLEEAKEGNYSLILLDVVMPGMDGFQLLQELKAAEVTRYIPVILITSLAAVQYEERGLLLGAVDYVTKPFKPVIIKARVNAHIQLYRYQMQFKEQAMVDGLTGVANRRRYEEGSLARWREATRFGLPFSICMFDIDKFKVYNDTFGHMAGDECLKKVAAALASRIHQGRDLICRFGGEEFQILLYGIKPEDALHAADRLRQAVADLKLPSADRRTAPYVTISVGASSAVPSSMETYNGMIKAADDELYYAKNHGKNMVSFREMPPEKESVPSSVSVTRCVAISCELPRF